MMDNFYFFPDFVALPSFLLSIFLCKKKYVFIEIKLFIYTDVRYRHFSGAVVGTPRPCPDPHYWASGLIPQLP